MVSTGSPAVFPDAAISTRTLPRARQISVFPVVTFLALLVAVTLELTGESTGAWAEVFGQHSSAKLLAGRPRDITSDMWQVQASWVAAQIAHGFPTLNSALPGGMDTTIQNDLPTHDWSVIFRPHTWLLLTGDLARGMAWRWWLPGWAALSSIHVFVRSLHPSQRTASWMLPFVILLSPLVQWWWRPTTLWPIAMCFLGLTAVVWAQRAHRPRGPVVWAALTGYVVVTTAMSIYVPYIVPCALVMTLGSVGLCLNEGRGRGWREVLHSLIPLASSALAAVGVLGLWVATRWSTVRAVLGTVYPGQRLTPTGGCSQHPGECLATFAGAWSRAIAHNAGLGELGGNSLEASTGLLICLVLAAPLLLRVVAGARRRRMDWLAVSVLIAMGLTFAFSLVPHWDTLAHLLLLDRSFSTRMRLALVVLDVVAVACLLGPAAESPRTSHASALLAAATAFGTFVVVRHLLPRYTSEDFYANRGAIAISLTVGIGAVLVVLRHPRIGTALLVVAALAAGNGINPLYRGYTDLRQTPLGRAIRAEASTNPTGRWVAVAGKTSYVETAAVTDVLLAVGVTSYNAVQTYPSREMWSEIDPSDTYENEWNRLANITWTSAPETGDPVVTNPAQDQISITFDACATFAQKNITFVVSTDKLDQACLGDEQEVADGNGETTFLYEIEPTTP